MDGARIPYDQPTNLPLEEDTWGKKKMPIKMLSLLAAMHIILGCIGVACSVTKFDQGCFSDDPAPLCATPNPAGLVAYACVLLCGCIVFIATGFIGICKTRNYNVKRHSVGSAFYGLSLLCVIISLFVWLAAGAEAADPAWVLQLLDADPSNKDMYVYKYIPWVLLGAGFAEFIVAILSAAISCGNLIDKGTGPWLTHTYREHREEGGVHKGYNQPNQGYHSGYDNNTYHTNQQLSQMDALDERY